MVSEEIQKSVYLSEQCQQSLLRVIGLSVILFLTGFLFHEKVLFCPAEFGQTEPNELRFSLDLNTAPKEEILLLPGIGETLAERILEYRKSGRFRSSNDVVEIRGIGPKKKAALVPYLDFST
ncbi:MAG: helix-hairpin-helix domain-containing protein [Planctomycetaceae bacterium]|jgi:DNA uptake protein ComE-like DNA-binding protein|nr:helix-hairpin-helix domain-containing protein [Planctomycetaceae bacterium]